MIVKMKKLHLAAISYDRDGILDALQRTNAVEIGEHGDLEGTSPLPEDSEALRGEYASLEAALSLLSEVAQRHAKEQKPLPDGVSVSYSEFMAAGAYKPQAEALIAEINALSEEKTAALAEQARLLRALSAASPYAAAELPFSAYVGTAHTKFVLGILPVSAWDAIEEKMGSLDLVCYEAKTEGDTVLLTLAAHKAGYAEAEEILSEAGFTVCPYASDETGKEQIAGLQGQLDAAKAREAAAERDLFARTSEIRALKIYSDYVGYLLEKAESAGKMRGTERTFLLEGFVPADEEERVKEALGAFDAVYYEFTDPGEDEEVPTLMKNNKVVENFETITNMYSVPNARELDPNTVMSFFYSLFIGFIMADIGYGLMMILGGGYLYRKNRAAKGGVKSLAGVFAFCGIFTIIWGFLFNSLFGIQILPFTVMPDAQTAMWTLAGIDIPAILIVSLLIGVVQLMAGYLCKMAQCIHRGRILDGVFEGGVWALFSLGAGLAIAGLVEDLHVSSLAAVGGIIAGASLIVAVLTAGRHEKFLGKITKGFSSVYGLINYFTDVLSYIRLYGLMLTGAVIAQIISQYSIQFMTSGSVLIALGVILMVVGHVFNLAISLLGAYIHTARLQYVEFFGKFYVGDGELFTPLGSNRKYVSVL